MPKKLQFPSDEQIQQIMQYSQEDLKKLELIAFDFAFCGFMRLNFTLSNEMKSNLKFENPH